MDQRDRRDLTGLGGTECRHLHAVDDDDIGVSSVERVGDVVAEFRAGEVAEECVDLVFDRCARGSVELGHACEGHEIQAEARDPIGL